MTISHADIIHIAKLAKLSLNEEQTSLLSQQLAKVLEHMQQLAKVDTEGLAATYHALEHTGVLRPDAAEPGLSIEEALANAPAHDERSFIVPKIL